MRKTFAARLGAVDYPAAAPDDGSKLNSLNSFTYTSPQGADKMYGPYFGGVIQSLYASAQS